MTKKFLLVFTFFIMLFSTYVLITTDLSYFIKEFIKTPMTTGAVGPSSWFAAKKLTAPLFHHQDGIKILEAGAGTGAMTGSIVKLLKTNDKVDVIEINPQFCDVLKNKFTDKRVNVQCLSLLDWNPPYKYDVIISTLPFSAFDAEQVQTFIEKFKSMSNRGTAFTYIEYMGAASIKNLFLSKQDRINHAQKNSVLAQFRKDHQAMTAFVWLSIPPAYIYRLTL